LVAWAPVFSDDDLYRRGVGTLVASWEAYARGAAGASVRRYGGANVAVFPREPEQSVYNNTVLERDLSSDKRTAALDAMESAYAQAGVTRFAAWVHERDTALCGDVEHRGYTLDTTTRAMGMALDDIGVPHPELDLRPLDWSDYLRVFDMPPGLLAEADHADFQLLVAHVDGVPVASALAFDFAGDCGVYNVGTVEPARRRGLGTALTARLLYAARARGCQSASLQSTPMAERVYAAVGFRDLGQFLEYVPPEA